MATIYDLKPRFQALLRPVCGGLAGAGVTANQVTVAAALLSAAGGAAILWQPEARWALLALPVVLFLQVPPLTPMCSALTAAGQPRSYTVEGGSLKSPIRMNGRVPPCVWMATVLKMLASTSPL